MPPSTSLHVAMRNPFYYSMGGHMTRRLLATQRPQPLFLGCMSAPSQSSTASTASTPSTPRHLASSASPSTLLPRGTSSVDPASSPVSRTAPVLAPDAANPPATTRPPPLNLPPPRDPADPASTSTFSHLFATGKAYIAFYKTGMRYLYENTKLVRSAPSPSISASAVTTRAHHLLLQRWRHDMRRLPIFGLLLIVCGELTPFAVLLIPRIVPYTCRIPRQVDQLQHQAETRRHKAFALQQAAPDKSPPATTICRSLGLISPLWDRFGVTPPHAHRVAIRHLRTLTRDDALLRQSGGPPALVPAELRLACADRGIDTLDRDDATLRSLLATWLAHTAAAATDTSTTTTHQQNADDAALDSVLHQRMVDLLTRRPNDWPA